MTRRYNILVLAYAVSPIRGSEFSVAWNYIVRMSRYHNLIVLYGAAGQHMGDNDELKEVSIPNVRFVFVDPNRTASLLNWTNRKNLFTPTFYLAYNIWHRLAYKKAKKIISEQNIDIIHYLNPIGYREPGFLWKLDKPYIWGPIGGTCNYPKELYTSLSLKDLIKCRFRDLINYIQFYHNHCLKRAICNCDVLITATTEDRNNFRNIYSKSNIYLPENGITCDVKLNIDKFDKLQRIELIFIGRLDAGKNLRLLLTALQRINNKDKFHLSVLGEGPEMSRLTAYAHKCGLDNNITWYGQRSRSEVAEALNKSHLHIISSMKEANTTVVFEAMSHGVPTLTLDHCGMHDTICEKCGFKIPIHSYEQVVSDMTAAIQKCIDNPQLLKKKAAQTVICAQKYLWDKREKVFLDCYEQAIAKHNNK